MKTILLTSLLLSLLMGGCLTKPLSAVEGERPYRYVIKDGESVKEIVRFPDLRWYHLPVESCIPRADIIDLTKYIIQLNNLIDEYEVILDGEGE